jgi:hypothetical protein
MCEARFALFGIFLSRLLASPTEKRYALFMRLVSAFCALFLIVPPAWATPTLSIETSARQLYDACTSEDAAQVLFCHGVVIGVSSPMFKLGRHFNPVGTQYSDFFIWKNAACGPQPSPDQLVEALGAWLERNQKIAFIRMVHGLQRTIHETWPCQFE